MYSPLVHLEFTLTASQTPLSSLVLVLLMALPPQTAQLMLTRATAMATVRERRARARITRTRPHRRLRLPSPNRSSRPPVVVLLNPSTASSTVFLAALVPVPVPRVVTVKERVRATTGSLT